MSETTEETPTEEPNPDAEPEEEIEGADDEDEQAEEPQTRGRTKPQRTQDQIVEAVESANTAYIAKIAKALGKDAPMDGCVYCQGLGFSSPVLPTGAKPVHPPQLVMCEDCNGFGEVITGSRNPDHITALCITCAGNGFVTKTIMAQNVTPITQTAPTAGQIQNGQLLPDGSFLPYGATEPIRLGGSS